jgi:hypothetical protein
VGLFLTFFFFFFFCYWFVFALFGWVFWGVGLGGEDTQTWQSGVFFGALLRAGVLRSTTSAASCQRSTRRSPSCALGARSGPIQGGVLSGCGCCIVRVVDASLRGCGGS